MLTLTPDRIDIWMIFAHRMMDQRALLECMHLLSSEEREKELSFHFPKDRLIYRLTRALVRLVLSRYLGLQPTVWRFKIGPNGRPEALNPEIRESQLTFNVSHTNNLVALAVTRGRGLGIDAECATAYHADIDLARRYFAPAEMRALSALAPTLRTARFFEYWTLKEAYIKARSLGLSLPLDQFSFQFHDDEGLEFAVSPTLSDDAAKWHFWQYWASDEHVVALCAERIGPSQPSIVITEAMPLVYERTLEREALRIRMNGQRARSG